MRLGNTIDYGNEHWCGPSVREMSRHKDHPTTGVTPFQDLDQRGVARGCCLTSAHNSGARPSGSQLSEDVRLLLQTQRAPIIIVQFRRFREVAGDRRRR